MGYWKSKVLPKIKKVFSNKKAAPAEAEKPAEETATVSFPLEKNSVFYNLFAIGPFQIDRNNR